MGGNQFQVNYAANGDGTANDISPTVIAVPEPGVWALLAAGTAFSIPCRRRRR